MQHIFGRTLISLAVAFTPALARANWDGSWWDPARGASVSAEEAADLLRASELVVLGEEHDNVAIQAAEAKVVGLLSEPSLGWEFLDRIDDEAVQRSFDEFVATGSDGRDLVKRLLPQSEASSYAPIFEALRSVSGRVVTTNLARAQKQPVTRGGLAAIDPSLIPSGFALGSEAYRTRFAEAMGAHPLPFPLENYFAAQCLTDDVMAASVLEARATGPRVLVTGSFHSDFGEGVVARFHARSPESSLTHVKFIDASELSADEIHSLFRNERGVPVADLVHVVGEPRS